MIGQTTVLRVKLTVSHLYAEIFPDKREQGRGKVDLPVHVDGHVHSYQFLVGQPIRTLVAEAQRRIHVLQHVVHLGVVDLTRGVGIVLGPYPDELVEMMGAENRRVSRQVIEVVHDDGDEKIEHEK